MLILAQIYNEEIEAHELQRLAQGHTVVEG